MEYIGGGKWEDTSNIHGHHGNRNARPVAEKKAVKTVAKVAAVAAAVYYGGAALKAIAGATGASSTAGAVVSAAKAASSIITPVAAVGGLALQAKGMYEQKQAAEKMQAYEEDRQVAAEKMQESQERQSDVEAQRARMAAVREQRIIQGRILASSGKGGFAFGGTSSFAGSTAALQTQLGTAIGNINVAQGFAGEQSAANLEYGRASSGVYSAANEASGWQQVSALGKELRGGQSIGQTVGTIFSI